MPTAAPTIHHIVVTTVWKKIEKKHGVCLMSLFCNIQLNNSSTYQKFYWYVGCG